MQEQPCRIVPYQVLALEAHTGTAHSLARSCVACSIVRFNCPVHGGAAREAIGMMKTVTIYKVDSILYRHCREKNGQLPCPWNNSTLHIRFACVLPSSGLGP